MREAGIVQFGECSGERAHEDARLPAMFGEGAMFEKCFGIWHFPGDQERFVELAANAHFADSDGRRGRHAMFIEGEGAFEGAARARRAENVLHGLREILAAIALDVNRGAVPFCARDFGVAGGGVARDALRGRAHKRVGGAEARAQVGFIELPVDPPRGRTGFELRPGT